MEPILPQTLYSNIRPEKLINNNANSFATKQSAKEESKSYTDESVRPLY